MSSSVGSRMAIGHVTGTTALIKVPLSFTPRYVQLFNVDGLVKAQWSDTMPHDSAIVQVTAGTISQITTGGITPIEQRELDDGADPARGFTIGTDSDINDTDEVIHYVAFE